MPAVSTRSLTSNVRPASGPPVAPARGSSSQVMPALYGSVRSLTAPTLRRRARSARASRRGDRARGVERRVDRVLARAVADHHIDLEVQATAVDLCDGAPIREALERATPELHARERKKRADTRGLAPADHDDDLAVGRHAIRRDHAVAVEGADPVRADHEHGAGIVRRRLGSGLHFRPAGGQRQLDASAAHRVACRGGARSREDAHGERRDSNNRSFPQSVHLPARESYSFLPRREEGKAPHRTYFTGPARTGARRAPAAPEIPSPESGQDARSE